MTLFFTSDQHYCHAQSDPKRVGGVLNLIPTRPWTDLDDMWHGLKDNYNARVRETDVVIHLGDLVMGKKKETIPLTLPLLKGRQYLILGNHDAGFDCSEDKFMEKTQIYRDNGIRYVARGMFDLKAFLMTCGETDLANSLGDLAINLCHLPYKGVADHPTYVDRYFNQKPDPSPTLLLHGHTHASVSRTADNMIHVGVDSWKYSPVSLEEILELYHS